MVFGSFADPVLVATHVRECFIYFQKVCDSLEKADPRIRQKILPGRFDDELGRFKIWCGNVGAHRLGKGSLDYKLREASHIHDQVIELLTGMTSSLGKANAIITGEITPWEDLSDSDSDVSEDSDKQDATELEQHAFSLSEINTCLMRLSMAIRNPAPHDQFKESAHFRVSHFEHFDMQHVRAKFPNAKEYLVARLGKAISRRRQYLNYREEHRQRLAQGLEPAADLVAVNNALVEEPQSEIMDTLQHKPETTTDFSERITSTVASSLPSALKATMSVTELMDEAYYEETLSQTSYASSGSESTRLRPPRIPKLGENGDPFECPLCFRFTSAQHDFAWRKHVYRDLQPYICTNERCETADRMYESRYEWFHHELQAHRKWWKCIDGCDQPFQLQSEFRVHLSHHHPDFANSERIEDLMRTCERQHCTSENGKVGCPLCHDHVLSFSLLRRHLGKHLEELALFALPSRVNEDGDETDKEQSDLRSLSSEAEAGSSPDSLSDGNSDAGRRHEGGSKPKAEPQKPSSITSSSTGSQDEQGISCGIDGCDWDAKIIDVKLRLAWHREWAHAGPKVFLCKKLGCRKYSHTEHDRIQHYKRSHSRMAASLSRPYIPEDPHDYFDALVSFYRAKGWKDVSKLWWYSHNRIITLKNLKTAIEERGGANLVDQKGKWCLVITNDSGSVHHHGKCLFTIYSEYIQPFDEHEEMDVYVDRKTGLGDLSLNEVSGLLNLGAADISGLDPKLRNASILSGSRNGLHGSLFYSSLFDFDRWAFGSFEFGEKEIFFRREKGGNNVISIRYENVAHAHAHDSNTVEIHGWLFNNTELVDGVNSMILEFLDDGIGYAVANMLKGPTRGMDPDPNVEPPNLQPYPPIYTKGGDVCVIPDVTIKILAWKGRETMHAALKFYRPAVVFEDVHSKETAYVPYADLMYYYDKGDCAVGITAYHVYRSHPCRWTLGENTIALELTITAKDHETAVLIKKYLSYHKIRGDYRGEGLWTGFPYLSMPPRPRAS